MQVFILHNLEGVHVEVNLPIKSKERIRSAAAWTLWLFFAYTIFMCWTLNVWNRLVKDAWRRETGKDRTIDVV